MGGARRRVRDPGKGRRARQVDRGGLPECRRLARVLPRASPRGPLRGHLRLRLNGTCPIRFCRTSQLDSASSMGLFDSIGGFGGRDMAVDLGTANTLVYVRGRGIVLSEPSVVAIDQRTGEVHAVGIEAKRMLGRTPGTITAIRPLKDGVIADFDVTEEMLRHFIQKVHQNRWAHPRVVVCVPSGVTGVEKRAVEEACLSAGARTAYPMEEEVQAEIRGRDMVSGLPKTVVLTSEEIRQALEEPVSQIIDAVKETLDRTPPELASDIMDRGIMLAGGGALLQGLDERLRHETQMPAHLAESPLTCVAVGSGRSLEEFEAIHRSNKTSRNRRRRT